MGEDLPEVYIDDILMSLKYYIDEHDAHLQLIEPDVCISCENKDCTYFCPVGAYRQQEDGRVLIAYQSCIECGSCRVMCPHNNVLWKFPRGGFGVAYKFG
ncbi:MAG: 4Fe-4S dicluster domain-containing protein [Chloroflexota bacterium]|nr:MAG: 4Fe-4S dicluster domain-containing protein [Chloroflexota bacterium]